MTTLSAKSKPTGPDAPSATTTLPIHFTASYAMGIIILSIALVFAGLLGLVQDWTYTKYGRPSQDVKSPPSQSNGHANGLSSQNPKGQKDVKEVPAWQESMFYLHFLAMPMFLFVYQDLVAQFRAVHAGPKLIVPLSTQALFESNPVLSYPLVHHRSTSKSPIPSAFQIPIAYFPLLLNTLTQLLCASGVHKLTGKVSSLTVTLTLVVRKAVSLVISVLLYGDANARGNVRMWIGAALVMLGTIGYSTGGKSTNSSKKAEGQVKEKAKKE